MRSDKVITDLATNTLFAPKTPFVRNHSISLRNNNFDESSVESYTTKYKTTVSRLQKQRLLIHTYR